MSEESRFHRAYLVRCWQEGSNALDGKPLWRFSVEELLHERRQRGFSSLEALIAYFMNELVANNDRPSTEP